MLAWWGYAIVVAAVVAGAGRLGARALASAGRPRRWSWVAGLSISVLWPLLVVAGWLPDAPFGRPGLLPLASPSTEAAGTPALSLLARVETVLPWLWVAASAVLLLAALAGEVALRRRCGSRVRLGVSWVDLQISPDAGPVTGPVTFGLLRPRIVLPGWVVAAGPRERRMIVLHELHHVRAGDVRLLWAAWAIVCAMPWNPAIWWQYGRLREAIELDCDRRCLDGRVDPRRYGRMLLRAAASRARSPLPAVGLVARRRLLVERIHEIAAAGRRPPGPRRSLALGAAACLVAVVLIPAPEGPLLPTAAETLETVTVTARGAGGVVRRMTAREEPGVPSTLEERETTPGEDGAPVLLEARGVPAPDRASRSRVGARAGLVPEGVGGVVTPADPGSGRPPERR